MKFTQEGWLNVEDICLAWFGGSRVWHRERILVLHRLHLTTPSNIEILAQLRVHIDGSLSIHQLLFTSQFELLIAHGLRSLARLMRFRGRR